MMQALSLMAAVIRVNLDDGAPTFSEALLRILHPHYLRPFPACSIARLDPTKDLPEKPVVSPRGTGLTSRGGGRFRTACNVALVPIHIVSARFSPSAIAPAAALPPDTTSVISITIESTAAAAPLHRQIKFRLEPRRTGVAFLVAWLPRTPKIDYFS